MKNSSSLYILKPILTFLLGLILVLSCSQEEQNPDMPAGSPGTNASEVVVNLLIKGEAILPPVTRQMTPEVEGSYQDDLQLLILEKQQDGTYIYNCYRPVEGTQGSFTAKVPSSLDGKELKFLLFSNSKDLIGDPDLKFVVADGTNRNEDYIRKALLLTVDTQWDPSKKIPMWAEDSFTFRVPANGAQATPVATLKLMRMLARVDVGLNYNGSELTSTARELTNFKLKQVKVHHSKSKGQLMPDANAYETAGTGADKVITIKTPSIPADGKDITPYGITVPDGSHASERDIYLFEQNMNLSQTDFDKTRTCILIQGEYTAPPSTAGGTGATYAGWYRLDFRNFGTTQGYADILRNKLYRFNITAVKGSGFATEEDALSSVSSNITVELLAMELSQNDVIFDGQSFLSVSGSELYFYRDRNTADFSLTTNYAKGWKITNGNGITATPAEGGSGSSVVKLTWDPTPSADENKEILLVAGNLKKKMLLKYVHESAPGDLTSFSLDPPFLYFVKDGGQGTINVVSNIIKKYLSTTLGNLNFTVPPETEAESFNVTVSPFTGTTSQSVEQGVVNVQVRAANADVKGQSIINQLTYDKQLACTPAVMEHGVVNSSSSSVSMDVSYTTPEAPGTYLIEFVPENGNGTALGPQPSNPVNGTGTVAITVTPNKTSAERTVGKLQFKAAEDGKAISLIGHTTKEFPIKQAPVPAPKVTITPTNNTTSLRWDQQQHGFTVAVDNPAFVENTNVAINLSPKGRTIDMTVPATGTLGRPVEITDIAPNRGETAKTRTVDVSVDGHGDHVGTGQVTFTQQAPAPPANEPSAAGEGELAWNSEGATLRLNNLSNIYEVTARSEAVGNSTYLNPTIGGNFTISADKTKATLDLVCSINPGATERKAKITATAIGNVASKTYRREFIITQKAAELGTISFAETAKTIEHTVFTGQVVVRSSGIKPGSINIQKSADWVTATLNADNTAVEYRVTANTITSDRVATITLTAKDLADRDLMTSPALTITQKAFPEGSITLSSSSVTIPSGGGTARVTFTYANLNSNGVKHVLVDSHGGHFSSNLISNTNTVECTARKNSSVNNATTQIKVYGRDLLSGKYIETILNVTQYGNQSGYFDLPPFYTQPSSGYNGIINLNNVANMRAGEYTATTSAGTALPGWLTITSATGHALNIRIEANTGKRRSQLVKVTGTDLEGTKVNQDLIVTQAGASGGIQVTPASHKFGIGRETKDFVVALTNIDMSKGIAIEGKPDWIESANLIDNNRKLRVIKRQNPDGNTGAAQGSITLRGTDYDGVSRQISVNISRKGNPVVVGSTRVHHTGLMDGGTQYSTITVNGNSRNVKSVIVSSSEGSHPQISNDYIQVAGDKRSAKFSYDIITNKNRYGAIERRFKLRWWNDEDDMTESTFTVRQEGHPDPYGSFDIPRENRVISAGQRVKFENRVCETKNLQAGTKIKARIRSQMGNADLWYQEIDANNFNKRFSMEVTAGRSESWWQGVVEIYGMGVDGQEKVLYVVSFTKW